MLILFFNLYFNCMIGFLLYRGYMICCYRVVVVGGGVFVEEVYFVVGELCGYDFFLGY